MNNEGRERLRKLTRKLADRSVTYAFDPSVSREEFELALEELDGQLREIRKKSVKWSMEKETN